MLRKYLSFLYIVFSSNRLYDLTVVRPPDITILILQNICNNNHLRSETLADQPILSAANVRKEWALLRSQKPQLETPPPYYFTGVLQDHSEFNGKNIVE